MTPKMRPARAPSRLAPLLLLLALAACGCGNRPVDPVLEGVPVSEELRRALDADAKAARTVRPDAGSVAALQRYDRLTVDIQRPQSRQAAGDSLYATWRREPTNFLWINHGAGYNYLLRRNTDRNAIYALPALADTSTAVGAYVYGRRYYGYGSDGTPYERAWARRAELDPLQRAWLVRSVAEVRGDAGDAVGAVRLLLAELPAARAVGGDRLAAEYWLGVAMRLRDEDRLDDALHAVVRAEGLVAGPATDYTALACRRQRADILAARQETGAAIDAYRHLIDEAGRAGFTWLVTSCLDQAAALHAAIGDLPGALAVDRENVAHSLAIADSINAPRCLMSLAHDFLMLGQPDSCLARQVHARELVEAFDDERNLAALPAMEAEYFLHVGDYATADSLLALASARAGRTGLAQDEAEILVAQVRQGLEMRRPEIAYRALARLEQIAPLLQNRGVHENLSADIHLATADFLGRQGEYVRAAKALAQALEAVQEKGGEGKVWRYHLSVGELAERRGDLVASAESFAAALAEADSTAARAQAAEARLALARVQLRQGLFADAAALLGTGDADLGFGEIFRARLASRQVLGAAQRQTGDLAASETTLDAALALVTARTPAHLAGRLHLEQGRTLAAAGRTEDALRQLGKAAALAVPSANGGAADRELQRDILEAGCALHVSTDTREAAHRTLALAAGFDILPSASGSSPQVVYFLGIERAYCWVYTDDGVSMHVLPAVPHLERLCRTTIAEYQAVHRQPDDRAARALSAALLAPALAAWTPGSTLRIVPDGLLSLLPWAALPWPDVNGESMGRVVDRGPILLVATGTGARAKNTTRGDDRFDPAALLSLGCNGNAEADGGPRLLAAEREAVRVAADWSHGRADVHTGADAVWTGALARELGRYRVIHIASHAVVHRGDASGAVLRLAGPDGTTPVTIDAVRDLDLRADLVYLSCCEAAGGRADAGGGTTDFAGAFLHAGAGAVIATPVRIDDRAAEAMATAFYRHWAPGGDVAASLRAAMLDVRNDPEHGHPGSWAFLRVIASF